jgi:hypothetical protein
MTCSAIPDFSRFCGDVTKTSQPKRGPADVPVAMDPYIKVTTPVSRGVDRLGWARSTNSD